MIVGNIATYPPRRDGLIAAVRRLAPQFSKLNVVLNEYDAVLADLSEFGNVEQIIPTHDTKDAGKFYPDIAEAEYVFMLDDDILYPDDYVEKGLFEFNKLGSTKILASFHGSIYTRPEFVKRKDRTTRWRKRSGVFWRLVDYPNEVRTYDTRLADFRDVLVFYHGQERPVVVDQAASGVSILRAEYVPSYDYMRDSQKFVDVRLARWAYETGLTSVVLPRAKEWLRPVRYDETIFNDFTATNPKHVNDEIRTFAGKSAEVGRQML